MKETYYVIVAPQMVWQWYYDENGGKCFRELLGTDAAGFIASVSNAGNENDVQTTQVNSVGEADTKFTRN